MRFWILRVGPILGTDREAKLQDGGCAESGQGRGAVSVDIRVPDRSEGDQDPGSCRSPQKPARCWRSDVPITRTTDASIPLGRPQSQL